MADLMARLCVMFSCAFVTFSYGVLGGMWYLIGSIPDLCILPYFVRDKPAKRSNVPNKISNPVQETKKIVSPLIALSNILIFQ